MVTGADRFGQLSIFRDQPNLDKKRKGWWVGSCNSRPMFDFGLVRMSPEIVKGVWTAHWSGGVWGQLYWDGEWR